jgi:cytoskeletal protein RodZ
VITFLVGASLNEATSASKIDDDEEGEVFSFNKRRAVGHALLRVAVTAVLVVVDILLSFLLFFSFFFASLKKTKLIVFISSSSSNSRRRRRTHALLLIFACFFACVCLFLFLCRVL